MKTKAIALVLLAAFASGCATRPANVAPTAVSSLRYDERTCKVLLREAEDVGQQLFDASARLDTKATNDAVAMGVGLILFWPALFIVGGGQGLEQEVARLKGEQIALNRKLLQQDCGAPPPPVAPPPAAPAALPVANK
jgi:hypothetical protein